jgi:hypothetical protein
MRLAKPLKLCLGLILGLIFSNAALNAAISVGPAGSSGPLTFNTLPAVADWSTLSVAGGAGDITDPAVLDTAVINNTTAAGVNTVLGSSGTQPPSQNAVARWNSAGFYLQTRPTGNNYLILMATVQNNTGSGQSRLVITYDWNQRNNIPVNESIAGHRVYYSMTGAAGSWILIPELSSFDNNSSAQLLSADITLPSTWANGANVYVIWVDDNGPGGTTDPMEGAYTIDNVEFSTMTVPPQVNIVQQPASQTIDEGFGVTFQVVASGRAPLMYQWFRDGVAITDATNSTYTITRVFRSDHNAVFTVQVSNDVPSSQTSTAATLTVRDDNTPPSVACAFGTNDNITLFVQFSEIVTNANVAANYTVFPAGSPETPLTIDSAVYANGGSEGSVVILTLNPSTPWVAPNAYSLAVGGVFDVIGNPINASQITPLALYAETRFAFDKVWTYNDPRADLPADWKNRTYDDGAWGSGPALLGVETAALTEPLRTQLTLGGITYYFRTHFTYNGTPGSGVLRFRYFLDDSAIVYLNGVEVTRIRMPSGPVSYSTEGAGGAIGDATMEGPVTFCVTNLLAGDNVVAVEVHQIGAGSSDILWGMELQTVVAQIEPVSILIQPTGTNVTEPRPFTLHVEARGSNPQYQWYHNDAPIDGATNASYIVSASNCDVDSGTYRVVIFNDAPSSVTSSTVTVNVACDVAPPRVVCLYGTNDTVVIEFNEQTIGGDVPFNYHLRPIGGGQDLGLDSATYTSGTTTGSTVRLVISASTPRDPNVGYELFIEGGIADLFENFMDPVTIPVPFFARPPVLGINDTQIWRYDDSGTDRSNLWYAVNYNDSTWEQGAAVFDAKRPPRTPPLVLNGETIRTVTTLSNAANTAQIPTHYFRTHFSYSGPTTATLQLRAMIDDGAVIYLNGQEIARPGMPAAPSPVRYGTLATRTQGDGDIEFLYLCVSNLVNGDNVLAVEVHQVNLTSSDITFGLEVSVYAATAPPRLTITRGPAANQVTVSWTGTGVLQQSTSLGSSPGGWSNVSGVSGNSYVTTTTGTARYFRVAPTP